MNPTHVFRAFQPEIRDQDLPDGVIGQVAGIAVVYDIVDDYGTIFAPGSLDRTRREKVAAGKVKLYWDHGDAPTSGGMYDSDLHIGTVRSLEDVTLADGRRAAYMVADIFDTPKGREAKQYVKSVLASGGETGLSVGFMPRKETKTKSGLRFDEVELREISVTSMQAVPDSNVLSVRAEEVVPDTSYAQEAFNTATLAATTALTSGSLYNVTTNPTDALRFTLEPEDVQKYPSLLAAFRVLLEALPHEVIRAETDAVLGNATTDDSNAPGLTPAASNAEAEDSRTTDPVVFATMEDRLRALRHSYAEALDVTPTQEPRSQRAA